MEKFFSHIRKMSNPAKSAVVFMIASFFQQGINIIITPVFTRIMSPSVYGLVSVYNSWIAIIGVIAMLSLSSGVFNVGMLDYKNDRDGFISSMLILSNIATVFFACIYLIFKEQIDSILQLPTSLIVLMFCTFLVTPATNFWTARQRFEYKYKLSAIVSIGSTILTASISVIAVINADSNLAVVRLWSGGVVTLSVALFFYTFLFIKGKCKINIKYWKLALTFNLPLIPHYLSQFVLSSSDKVIISNLVSQGAAGIYSLVYTIPMISMIAWNAINGSLVPYTFEKMKRGEYSDIDFVVKPLLVIISGICIAVTLFAPEIIRILATPEYYEGVYVVPPVAASIFFTVLYYLFANIEFYYKKTLFVMIATIIAAVLNIVLNLIFIPLFGYYAAGYTTLVAYIIYAVLHYMNIRRIQKKDIYNIKFIIFCSVGCVMFCLLSTFLYSNTIIRYSVIIVGIIVTLVLRKKIVNAIMAIRKS